MRRRAMSLEGDLRMTLDRTNGVDSFAVFGIHTFLVLRRHQAKTPKTPTLLTQVAAWT